MKKRRPRIGKRIARALSEMCDYFEALVLEDPDAIEGFNSFKSDDVTRDDLHNAIRYARALSVFFGGSDA